MIRENSAQIISNLFTSNNTWEEKLDELAHLEHSPAQFVELLKTHHPYYVFNGLFGEEVAKFKLIEDLKKYHGK